MKEEIRHIPMTRNHVSKLLGVSLSTVDRMKKRGVLEISDRIGNVVLFDHTSVSHAREFLDLREWFFGEGQ